MSIHTGVEDTLIIDGNLVTVKLIDGPLVDDILEAEARVFAHSLVSGADLSERRTPRDIRDFLIKIGLES